MSSKIPFPPAGFDELSLEDQIEYVQELWDKITADPEQVSVPDWHWEILEKRMADPREGLENGMTWEEFEKELEKELKQS